MVTKRIQQLQPSATLTLEAKVKELKAKGERVVSFTLGEPDFPTPPAICRAAIKAITSGFTHYTPSAGIGELRSAIAQKLKVECKVTYDPNEIIVGVGTKQLLHAAFLTLVETGDEVLIPTPTWTTYVEQVKLAGAKPVLIPLKRPFQLKAKDLLRFITPKTKVLLLNSPANPTGAMIAKSELKKIAKLVVKHKLFVISDEIYEKIVYGKKPTAVASMSQAMKQQTLTINGFSKAYAMTGWRVGYAAGPQEVIAGMVALAGQTTSGTCSISQMAALAACKLSSTSIDHMVRQFAARREYVFRELSQIPGFELHKPDGAFYMFPNIEKLLGGTYKTSAQWAQALLENQKVAVVPGEAFLAPGYIRLSFASSMSELKEGLGRIRKFVESESKESETK